jgi:hypothetical protein
MHLVRLPSIGKASLLQECYFLHARFSDDGFCLLAASSEAWDWCSRSASAPREDRHSLTIAWAKEGNLLRPGGPSIVIAGHRRGGPAAPVQAACQQTNPCFLAPNRAPQRHVRHRPPAVSKPFSALGIVLVLGPIRAQKAGDA